MSKTLFQKIVDREIPSTVVYEDDIAFAFFDINPVTKGHTLLITKNPYPWMTDVPNAELAHTFAVAKKIMQAMKSNLGADFVVVKVVGTDVPHFHIHLIPKKFEQPSGLPRAHEPYTDEVERDTFAEKIKNALL
jgi:histidine triad (HIT) family protein